MDHQKDILIIDDEEGFRKEIGEYLSDRNMRIHSAGLPSEAIALLEKNPIDIAVFDIRLPEMSGLTLLKQVKETYPKIEVIMMTGYGEMDSVVQALRYGAADYLNKPFKLEEIREAIERVTKYQTINNQASLSARMDGSILDDQLNLIGESKALEQITNSIQKIARSYDTTVLITGESGTGKELVARAIHFLSDRRKNHFIPVNCSTIPEELFENEFFGHVKGSYTDAKEDQKGLFEVADKGTLFLDEIGDMKFNMQAKLLRVLEDKKVSRIGHFNERDVDVRVITATNQNLEELMETKKFRSDLFHRLNLFRIDIPPLRERKDDIPILFNYFVDILSKKLGNPISKVEKTILTKLMDYDFPGNIRELKNMIESALIICDKDILTLDCFKSINSASFLGKQAVAPASTNLDLNTLEQESIMKALSQAEGNKSKAARMLHISRQALDRKIKKYNL